jgi:hypothetical protein
MSFDGLLFAIYRINGAVHGSGIYSLAFHHWKLSFYSRAVRVEFVVDSVVAGNVYLVVLRFYPACLSTGIPYSHVIYLP